MDSSPDTGLKYLISERPTRTFLRGEVADDIPVPTKQPQKTTFALPEIFDGVKVWKGCLTPIFNQGSCGSCWAFASTSTLSDRYNIQSMGLNNIQLSPAKLILCDLQGKALDIRHPEFKLSELASIQVEIISSGSCYGNSLSDAFRYLYVIGVCTEKCLPYTSSLGTRSEYHSLQTFSRPVELPFCSNIVGPLGDMCSDYFYDSNTDVENGTPARIYRASYYYALPNSERDIREDIYHWGPVCTAFKVYSDFYTFDAVNTVYEWDGVGEVVGGHAVEIVGWGIDKNGTETKPYWLIKNSWGVEWGIGGYFRMVRGKDMCGIESNVVSVAPDFFYPKGHAALEDNTVSIMETNDMARYRSKMESLYASAGGIDSTTGYTRRIMLSKPWINFSRPIRLSDLPDWDRFVAGEDASPNKRVEYRRTIRETQSDIRYGIQTSIIYISVMTVILVPLVVLTIISMRKFYKSA